MLAIQWETNRAYCASASADLDRDGRRRGIRPGSATVPKPRRQHGGTGIGPDRDIAVLWCDIAPPCASPPTAPPTERHTPAENRGFST